MFYLEPCEQSIGLANGMIVDSNIKINNLATKFRNESIRLSDDLCLGNTSSVQVDLVRLMSITGLAFYSDVQTEVTVRFGIDDDNLESDFKILMEGSSTDQKVRALKQSFTLLITYYH